MLDRPAGRRAAVRVAGTAGRNEEEGMRSTFLRSSLMTAAVVLLTAATVLAGEPQPKKEHGSKLVLDDD